MDRTAFRQFLAYLRQFLAHLRQFWRNCFFGLVYTCWLIVHCRSRLILTMYCSCHCKVEVDIDHVLLLQLEVEVDIDHVLLLPLLPLPFVLRVDFALNLTTVIVLLPRKTRKKLPRSRISRSRRDLHLTEMDRSECDI